MEKNALWGLLGISIVLLFGGAFQLYGKGKLFEQRYILFIILFIGAVLFVYAAYNLKQRMK